MSFTIITDSAASLNKEHIDKYNIEVLALNYIIDGCEYPSYIKNTKTDLQPLYEKMKNKAVVSTACLNEEYCKEEFEKVLKDGKDFIYIGLSSGLSATYNNVQRAIEYLRSKYPQRKIYACDSLGASMGQGLLTFLACQLREQGGEIELVYDWLEENKLNMNYLFTVDSLSYLYRGGRVKKSAYLMAGALKIKPVLNVDEQGLLTPIGKTFGRKTALCNLVSRMQQLIINPESQTIFVAHSDCHEDAQYFLKKIEEKVNVKEIVIGDVGVIAGAHVGPGTIAVFFLGKSRLKSQALKEKEAVLN